MNGKSLRTFDVDGRRVIFNTARFNRDFREKAKQAGKRLAEYEKEVGRAVYVGPDAVHSWRMGGSGPGDIEKIQTLASFWDLRLEALLKKAPDETKETTMTTTYTERQLEALRRIYVTISEYLEEYLWTGNFSSYKHTVTAPKELRDTYEWGTYGFEPEEYREQIVEGIRTTKYHEVYLAIMREGFDLRDLPVYDRILDYWADTLHELYWDGFFLPQGSTLHDYYEFALDELHEILDATYK